MSDMTDLTATFWYWINERHQIYRRKDKGEPFPWTKDAILREYKFTNVFRQLDRVTRVLTRRITEPHGEAPAGELLANIIKFRLFNLPSTYKLLGRWQTEWDEDWAKRQLHAAAQRGEKIFTGAYISSNNGESRSKIDLYCEAVTVAYAKAKKLAREIEHDGTLQGATAILQRELPMFGPFVAYEVVSDLRWTCLLDNAPDIMTWANPGPGATRGLNRIHGRKLTAKPSASQLVREMRDLLRLSQKSGVLGKHVPRLEMREIEHSLCEFDKYMRVTLGEGRPRSRYVPPSDAAMPAAIGHKRSGGYSDAKTHTWR